MEDLLFDINETARAIRRAIDQRAAVFGVTRAQWRVLVRLKREPGLRQVELAERLDMEPITLCRIIDRLEESGLVERSKDPDDRRARLLHVTAEARPIVEKLQALASELAGEAFAGVDPKDVEITRRVLAQVRDNVGRNASNNRASEQ